MDLLKLAKELADRVEAEAAKVKIPVSVCVMDIHGNSVLLRRMNGAKRDCCTLRSVTSGFDAIRATRISPGSARFTATAWRDSRADRPSVLVGERS